MPNFTIGTDPEFMLYRDDKFHSAIGIVPGSKDKRHVIGQTSFYYDNVMAECTVQPAKTREEFISNLKKAISTYANLIRPYRLAARASHVFSAEQLDNHEARKIGCDPEICAYVLDDITPSKKIAQMNEEGEWYFLTTFHRRSAGGHIHIGSQFAQDPYNRLNLIRMLDLFLGLPAVLIDNDETSKARKALYGQAGRFRKPKHGVEYRTLGNFWLSSPTYAELIYDITAFVVDFVEAGKWKEMWDIDFATLKDDNAWNTPGFNPAKYHSCKSYDLKALRKAIDSGDRKKAESFLTFIQNYLPAKIVDKIEALRGQIGERDIYQEWGIR